MKHLSRTHFVANIDGVKIMHNPKHNETIFILPSAMNGAQFMDWKKQHAPEIREFVKTGRVAL